MVNLILFGTIKSNTARKAAFFFKKEMNHEKLFDNELLAKGKFPKLDSRGKTGCRHEIKLWGFQKFLEDGWDWLETKDRILAGWLNKLIDIETVGSDPRKKEQVSRSIRYGAALVYYPLLIQVEESHGDYTFPEVSEEQEGSLKFDLHEVNVQPFVEFLAGFDPELAGTMGEILTPQGQQLQRQLEIDSLAAYLGAYFTYFALASKGESLGMENLLA